jgi:ribosomal protein L35
MKKSISSRIKITKTGKILRRRMGQSHFLAKKSGNQIKRGKGFNQLNFGRKIVRKYS